MIDAHAGSPAMRLGVDIGGTFTDFALLNLATGAALTHKTLSTPADPARAVLTGAAELLERQEMDFADLEAIVHGTTLVTNAVIERRGARTGMLVTRGFRDRLDIGREYRYDLFDLRLAFPEPVVPRARRHEIGERVRYDGRIERALDPDEALAAVDALVRDHGIESLAVCFLHAYANPAHERRAEEAIARAFPRLCVSLSAEVAPFMRELERWTTATINAYTQPMVARYLDHLQSGLAERGFAGRLYVMNSAGGTLIPEIARRYPVRLLESGPAAGVLMCAQHSRRRAGPGRVLSFDMGGTTTKGALIRGREPLRKYEIEVARVHAFKKGSGLSLKIPALDLIEIGSGGGGIATRDQRGLIRVGPRSAGADPGPACYGRGGSEATLTDANLLLGYLDPGFFLGGAMVLDQKAAEAAVREQIAKPLGLEVERAAFGIHETVNEDVARAFRVHAAEHGFDYRGCAMIAFGGSGPVHALRIAKKLKMAEVVFPAGAGVTSAFGLLVSPLSHEVVRSDRVSLEALDAAGFETRLGTLADQASAPLREAGVEGHDLTLTRRLDMRHLGQGYEIEVEVPDGLTADEAMRALPALFAERYEQIFSISFLEQPLEIVHWKVEAKGPPPLGDRRFRLAETATGPQRHARKGSRPAYFPEAGGFVDCAVYDRYALRPGDAVRGPALVEERESTFVLGIDDRAILDEQGNLVGRPAAVRSGESR